MFEHVRNYQKRLRKFSLGSKADGMLWCHIFCHRFLHYPFEIKVNMTGCHATFYRWSDAINVYILTFPRSFRAI